MNIVLQPRPLLVLGLNVWMGTDAGADELVEIPAQNSLAVKALPTPFLQAHVMHRNTSLIRN